MEMAKLEKKRVDAGGARKLHFDFAGKFFEETEKSFFDQFVAENKLEDYITYHGVVGGKEKQELLDRCDFFALLTTYPNEGQPISILEAMGNGMVIITTDHAGIADIVKNGENGIVQNKRCISLEDIYAYCIGFDTNEMKNIICENRRKVEIEYSEREYISKMAHIFEII